MRKVLVLLLACCPLWTLACLNTSDVNQEVVELSDIRVDDGTSNEVVMTDSDTENRLAPIATYGEKPEDSSYTDKDGSNVRISYDAAGNKTVTRYFFDHPNLKMLMVTTSNDGTITEGIVFGHNNEKAKLPPDLMENAITANAKDIAYKVGITTTKIEGTITKAQPNQVYVQQNPVYPTIPDPRRQPEYSYPQPQTQSQKPSEVAPEVANEDQQSTSSPSEPQTEQKPAIAQEKRKKDGEN